jgi:hypothetical protein
MMNLPSRRNLFQAAQKYLLDPSEEQLEGSAGEPPRLTSHAIQQVRMSREAFERAKLTADESQMASLDFAYRREQLYFEILLDVRDAVEKR